MIDRLVALACALSGLLCACTHPEASAKVFSGLPYEQAVAQAQSEHKLLLIDATASWCGPCQKMERTTWRDGKVSAWLAAHAIAVQVDVDREAALARQLGIEVMPTLIVVENGKELARSRGYLDADQLLAWLAPLAGG